MLVSSHPLLTVSAYRLNMTLGEGIKASLKIRAIFLRVATSSDGMRLIVLIHATCGKDSAVDIRLEAGICQVERADGVGSHRL